MANLRANLSFDIVIVGAGLVGAAAAVALTQQGYSVALVDRKAPVFNDDPAEWDSRIYAISPGNVAWLKQLDVWPLVDAARLCDIDQMQVWGDGTQHPLIFDAYESNAANLGIIAESQQIHQALWQTLQNLGVHMQFGVECARLEQLPEKAILHLVDGTQLHTELLIGADSGNSWVRAQAGIGVQVHQYQQQAVVANFTTTSTHQQIARQWFRGDDIMAYLPMAGNRMSIVWSTPQAEQLLKLSDAEFVDAVAQAGQHCLGELSLLTPATKFTLVKQSAVNMVQARLALMGDAAHRIHPLAGQGVNLGFRDVIGLVQALGQRNRYQSVGDIAVLRAYERARKSDMLSLGSLTHGLQWLFENDLPSVKKIRNVGMELTNQQAWLKRLLVKHAII
jgi:2-octaprenylphenol hydroxylase